MNVFFVDNPLQLLNATEAKHFLGLKNNILIIIVTMAYSIEFFDNILDKKRWESVIFLRLPYVSEKLRKYDFGKQPPRNLFEKSVEIYIILKRILERYRIDCIAKRIKFANNIIVGNYRENVYPSSLHRHFVNQVEHTNLILVDDGTDVIWVNEERKKLRFVKKDEVINDLSITKKFRKWLRKRFYEWNTTSVERLTFFTCYNLSTKAEDIVIQHDYQYFRKRFSHSISTMEVIFLGQCLVDDGYITIDDYIKYLDRIKKYFRNEQVIYVPHPRESGRYVDAIKNEIGFEIRSLRVPFEYEVGVSGKRPKCISSFFCSALEHCLVLFGDQILVKAFYIYPEDINKNRAMVHDIYEYFEAKCNNNFEVIRLASLRHDIDAGRNVRYAIIQ